MAKMLMSVFNQFVGDNSWTAASTVKQSCEEERKRDEGKDKRITTKGCFWNNSLWECGLQFLECKFQLPLYFHMNSLLVNQEYATVGICGRYNPC